MSSVGSVPADTPSSAGNVPVAPPGLMVADAIARVGEAAARGLAVDALVQRVLGTSAIEDVQSAVQAWTPTVGVTKAFIVKEVRRLRRNYKNTHTQRKGRSRQRERPMLRERAVMLALTERMLMRRNATPRVGRAHAQAMCTTPALAPQPFAAHVP